MWDPHGSKHLWWTKCPECDHPGLISLHYEESWLHIQFCKKIDDNTVSMLQMLGKILFFHTEKNDSFSLTGLHHQFEPNKLLVHCEYHFAFCSWPFAFLTNTIYILYLFISGNFLLSNFPPPISSLSRRKWAEFPCKGPCSSKSEDRGVLLSRGVPQLTGGLIQCCFSPQLYSWNKYSHKHRDVLVLYDVNLWKFSGDYNQPTVDSQQHRLLTNEKRQNWVFILHVPIKGTWFSCSYKINCHLMPVKKTCTCMQKKIISVM